MPAVVRIKRRIDEEPLSAFLLNGKKRRIEDGGSEGEGAVNNQAAAVARNKELTDADNFAAKDEISTVLKFAGTIKEQDDTTQIMRLTKNAAKEIVEQRGQRRVTNHTDRIRNEMRQSVRDQRYRVVNCMRTTCMDATASNELTIVDIEEDRSSTPATTTTASAKKYSTQNKETRVEERPTDSDTGYVYDLYLPENEELVDDVDLMDDYLRLVAHCEEIRFTNRYYL